MSSRETRTLLLETETTRVVRRSDGKERTLLRKLGNEDAPVSEHFVSQGDLVTLVGYTPDGQWKCIRNDGSGSSITGWIRTIHLHKVKKKIGSMSKFVEVADEDPTEPAAWEKDHFAAVSAPRGESTEGAERKKDLVKIRPTRVQHNVKYAKPKVGRPKGRPKKIVTKLNRSSTQPSASSSRPSELKTSSTFVSTEVEGLKSGTTVRLHGLVQQETLNGRLGILKEFDHNRNRWSVALDNGQEKSVQSKNFVVEGLPAMKKTLPLPATPVIVKGVEAIGQAEAKKTSKHVPSETVNRNEFRIHFRCDGKASTPLRCLADEDAPYLDVDVNIVQQKEMVQLLRFSDDGQWARVQCASGVGWIRAALLQHLPGEGSGHDKAVTLSPLRKAAKTVKRTDKLKPKHDVAVRRRMVGKTSPRKVSAGIATGKMKGKEKGSKKDKVKKKAK